MSGVRTTAFPRLETYAEKAEAPGRRGPRLPVERLAPSLTRPEAVAAASILALYLLTRLLLLWRMPHFIDESTHAGWAYDAYHDPAARFESLTQGKEPLLIWLAAGFMKLGANPLTAIRWVSFFAGLLTMTMVALLARRFGGTRLALAAAAIYVVLPFVVVHDVIGIMDPLVTALMGTALVLQLRMAERPRLDVALGLGLVMGAAVLTKESGKVAAVLLPVSLLLFDWRAPDLARRLAKWAGCAAVALVLTGLGLLVLHLSPLYSQLQADRTLAFGYPVRSIGDGLSHPFRWWGDSWHVYRPALIGYVTIPLLIAAAVGAVDAVRRWRLPGIALLAWIAVPFGAAVLLPIHPYPRHILYVVPPLVVLVALGGSVVLRAVAERVRPRERARAAVAAVTVVALLPALIFDARVIGSPSSAHYPSNDDEQYVTGWQSGVGLNDVASRLQRLVGNRRAFVVYTSGYPEAFRFLVDRPKVTYVPTTSPASAFADYLVEFPHAKEFPDFAVGKLLPSFRLVQTVDRPRSDLAIRLYVRR